MRYRILAFDYLSNRYLPIPSPGTNSLTSFTPWIVYFDRSMYKALQLFGKRNYIFQPLNF